MEHYTYTAEVYAGNRIERLVHRAWFDLTDEGYWSVMKLCNNQMIDGGYLPIRYNKLKREEVVTCLFCLVMSS